MAAQPPLPPPPMASGQAATGQTDGMAVASMVLGILSIPGAFLYGVFGII